MNDVGIGVDSSEDGTVDMQRFPPPLVPPEVDAILASMPEDWDVQAWRDPHVHQRVLQCVEAETNTRNTYRDAVNIEAVHTDKVHYYKYKGKRAPWISPSGFLKGKTFPEFEADRIADRLIGTKNTESAYYGKKREEVQGVWRQTAVDGRAKHAFFDMSIQRPDVPIPENIPDTLEHPLEVPTYMKRVNPTPAFYRCLAHILRHFVFWATEVTLYDAAWEVVGQTDIILQDRVTGLLVIADWKNCGTNDLGDETKAYGRSGCHVSTAHLPDTKLNHYLFQTTMYRKMAKRRTHGEWPPFAKRVILYNFNPKTPNLYETYDRPSLDMRLFFSCLPWRDKDPRHTDYFVLPTLVPRLTVTLPPLPPADRVTIAPGLWRDPNVIWLGRQYPPRTEAGKVAEAMTTALEAGDLARAWEAYTALAEKRERYTLPNSPYHHPWFWMSGKDPDPPGCNAYYEWWLLNNRKALSMLPAYVGKRFACWCKPGDKGCHADIFARYVKAYECGAWRPDLSFATLFPGEDPPKEKKPKKRTKQSTLPMIVEEDNF